MRSRSTHPASVTNFSSGMSGNWNSVNITSLPEPLGTTRIGFRISKPRLGIYKVVENPKLVLLHKLDFHCPARSFYNPLILQLPDRTAKRGRPFWKVLKI